MASTEVNAVLEFGSTALVLILVTRGCLGLPFAPHVEAGTGLDLVLTAEATTRTRKRCRPRYLYRLTPPLPNRQALPAQYSWRTL
jgi:hypothetical protein